MKLSFVIPTINQVEMVETCLGSLVNHNGSEHEIIVVDDGSTTEIRRQVVEICKKYQAKILVNNSNIGFSNTVNRGIDSANGDIVVLVNNDVVFTQNITEELRRCFNKDEKIGIVGGLLFYPRGTIQHGGVTRYHGGFIHKHWHKQLSEAPDATKSEYMVAVTGALFAIRKKMTDEIGVMNSRYFLACEDTELCLRAWANDWKVYYSGNVRAIHAEGATRGNNDAVKMQKGRHWLIKENETNKLFLSDLKNFNLKEIDSKIAQANSNAYKEKIIHGIGDCGVIGVNRMGAVGDVILTTGIVRKLKELYPNHDIYFSTFCGSVYRNNPNITKIVGDKNKLVANIIIDLDMAYERMPNMNIIDAYARAAFHEIKTEWNLRPELFTTDADVERLMAKIPRDFLSGGKFAVIHMAVSWPNRTWPRQKWLKVIDNLVSRGCKVAVIGKGGDFKPDARAGVLNLVDKLDILETKELIERSSIFLGMDSGMLHVAMTTSKPVLGLFTCADPKNRLFARDAQTISVIPKVSCRFCLHEEKPPVTFTACRTGHYQCLRDITEQEVINKTSQVIFR